MSSFFVFHINIGPKRIQKSVFSNCKNKKPNMKAYFLASLLVVAVSASLLQEHAVEFQAFKTVHGKSYLNQVEETKRFSIFRENLRAIEEHNALYEQGLASYKQKITKFADKTQEEFKAYLGLHKKPTLMMETTKYVKTGVAIPESVDWRQEGQVTRVKDQGDCGSCWAFSVTGTVEGAYFRESGKLVSLSEEQLVECATEVNSGCDGGFMAETMPYVQQDGLQSEETYPYKARDRLCSYNSSNVVTKISSYVVLPIDEEALLEAVATVGPVSVAMNANYLGSYGSGVFHDSRCTPAGINHGVLIVGYGSENGKDYWIVKNSWGTQWGEEGYLKLARGSNECGVTEKTVYPVV